jgi:hypothetical protein
MDRLDSALAANSCGSPAKEPAKKSSGLPKVRSHGENPVGWKYQWVSVIRTTVPDQAIGCDGTGPHFTRFITS